MPILPLGDDNPHGDRSPVNWAFILVALAVMAFTVFKDHDFSLTALEPYLLPLNASFPLSDATDVKLFFAGLFMHENPWQMALYLYMLWMLGDNIEYVMGHVRYIVFFLLCGLGGLAAQIWLAHQDNTLSFIGMGAVAFAVCGAYIACFPKIQVNIIWFFEENYMSVKTLPFLFLLGDLLAGLWYTAGSFKEIPQVPVLQHVTAWVIHMAFFIIGYGLFFVFRNKSIVIEMPLHIRSRAPRTGGDDSWR